MKTSEPRWPSLFAFAAIAFLYTTLPEQLSLGPNWAIVAVIAVLLIPTVATHKLGMDKWNHYLGQAMSWIVTLALVWSVVALVLGLPQKKETPLALLKVAASLWLSNVFVFATWYWRLDAGGPHKRGARREHDEGSFAFPQMTSNPPQSDWRPEFMDYLFLAFNTSTAFSPTDTAPLTRWAKGLMMLQSLIALISLAVLAARALNTL